MLLAPALASAVTALVIILLYPLRQAVKDDLTLQHWTPLNDKKKEIGYLIRKSKLDVTVFMSFGCIPLMSCVLTINNYVFNNLEWFSPAIQGRLKLHDPFVLAAIIALVGGLGFGVSMRKMAKNIRRSENMIRVIEEKEKNIEIRLAKDIAAESDKRFWGTFETTKKLNQRIEELEDAIELRQGDEAERAFIRAFARFCTKTDPTHKETQVFLIKLFQRAMERECADPEWQLLISRLSRSKNTLIRRILDTRPNQPKLPRSPS